MAGDMVTGCEEAAGYIASMVRNPLSLDLIPTPPQNIVSALLGQCSVLGSTKKKKMWNPLSRLPAF